MSSTTKLILSCLGTFIGGAGGYWKLHGDPGILITTPTFWISFVMAGLYPLGVLFLGLSQTAPWQVNKPPQGGTS